VQRPQRPQGLERQVLLLVLKRLMVLRALARVPVRM
jgi:hypothetical protein